MLKTKISFARKNQELTNSKFVAKNKRGEVDLLVIFKIFLTMMKSCLNKKRFCFNFYGFADTYEIEKMTLTKRSTFVKRNAYFLNSFK